MRFYGFWFFPFLVAVVPVFIRGHIPRNQFEVLKSLISHNSSVFTEPKNLHAVDLLPDARLKLHTRVTDNALLIWLAHDSKNSTVFRSSTLESLHEYFYGYILSAVVSNDYFRTSNVLSSSTFGVKHLFAVQCGPCHCKTLLNLLCACW